MYTSNGNYPDGPKSGKQTHTHKQSIVRVCVCAGGEVWNALKLLAIWCWMLDGWPLHAVDVSFVLVAQLPMCDGITLKVTTYIHTSTDGRKWFAHFYQVFAQANSWPQQWCGICQYSTVRIGFWSNTAFAFRDHFNYNHKLHQMKPISALSALRSNPQIVNYQTQ